MKTTEKIILNPISDLILERIGRASEHLLFSVPFISSFAKDILKEDVIRSILDKKLITRFDETNINSFNIPTLQYLLKNFIEKKQNLKTGIIK